jgi:hypothetical protein
MPLPCCFHAVLKADSHTMPFPCHYPAILRQYCVLRESSLSCAWSPPAISFQELSFTKLLSQSLCCKLHKHSCPCTNTIILSPSITNAALFHTGHCISDRYAADNKLTGTGSGSSKGPKAGKSATCRHPATALRSRFQKVTFVAWQGNGMVCVNLP